jgi:hypothetical protein
MRETRAALEPVVSILRQAGFWAYPLYGDEGWLVACDTESGRIDVRIGTDGYLVEVWDVSPGLYFDEEDERKRAVKERLARLTLSRLVETIRHAPVTDTERLLREAWWDEEDERKRAVKERLARLTLSRLVETIRHAPVTDTERLLREAWWDEAAHGVGLRIGLEIPFSASASLPELVTDLLERLNELLERLEERLLD